MAAVLQTMAAQQAATRGTIIIDDVVKIYDPGGAAVMAVDHCSLEIQAGEICMIVGPSGCGKTTLLNAIAGFHEITSGRILLDGEVLCSADKPKAAPGSDRIVVFQNGALFPWKTNLENVAFGPMMQGTLGRAEAREKALGMMADAGLAGSIVQTGLVTFDDSLLSYVIFAANMETRASRIRRGLGDSDDIGAPACK